MPITTSFGFDHAHPQSETRFRPLDTEAAEDLLGLLRGLVGNEPGGKPQRTWKGTGFNMIWRPNFDSEFGSQPHFLESNLTAETLSFTDITGPTGIANRGLLQKGISSAASPICRPSTTVSTTAVSISNPTYGPTCS